MAKKRVNPLIFLFVASFGVLAILFLKNSQHANTKHPEAPTVRATYNEGRCEGVEVWFSPLRGTVLILCGLPQDSLWGGMIFRVTENQHWLGDNAYECSVFVAQRKYWTKVLLRDGYFPLANYPDIERLFTEWYN